MMHGFLFLFPGNISCIACSMPFLQFFNSVSMLLSLCLAVSIFNSAKRLVKWNLSSTCSSATQPGDSETKVKAKLN